MKNLRLTSIVMAILLPGASALAQQDFRQYSNQELFQNMHQYTHQMNQTELNAYRAEMQYRARRMSPKERQTLGLGTPGRIQYQDRDNLNTMNQQQLQKRDETGLKDRDRDRSQDCVEDGIGGANNGGNGGSGNGGGNEGSGNGGGNGGSGGGNGSGKG